MTQDLENGMTIAMSIWESDSLDWLQHGECNTSCGEIMGQEAFEMPDLKFKNLVFTTGGGASGSGGSGGSGDSGNSRDSGNNGGTTVMTDIAAEFENIKNNPHYGNKLSRTLYQVD